MLPVGASKDPSAAETPNINSPWLSRPPSLDASQAIWNRPDPARATSFGSSITICCDPAPGRAVQAVGWSPFRDMLAPNCATGTLKLSEMRVGALTKRAPFAGVEWTRTGSASAGWPGISSGT